MTSSQTKVLLSVGENSLSATLADNEATGELKTLLASGPITVRMSDYGGFEKVGELPQSFTTSDSRITTSPGDIMLYQGNNIVIFYGTNTWSYTPLGKIDNADSHAVKQFLSSGPIDLKISLETTTEIDSLTPAGPQKEIVFDLQGNRIDGQGLKPGVYIIRGKKTIVR